MKRAYWIIPCTAFVLLHASGAWAQEEEQEEQKETSESGGQVGATAGEGEENIEAHPVVPGQGNGDGEGLDVKRQAGTGSDIAYAEAGVLELGGSGAFEVSSAGTFLALRPFVGWFIANNIELTGIIEGKFVKPDGGDWYTTFMLMGEPSFHFPITNRVLGFAGLGIGVAHNDDSFGLAVRPRLGLDMLVGRSGIFRPSVDLTWSSADVVSRSGDTLVAVKTAFGVSFGYSVMF